MVILLIVMKKGQIVGFSTLCLMFLVLCVWICMMESILVKGMEIMLV